MSENMILGRALRAPLDKQLLGIAVLCAALLSIPPLLRFCGDDGGTNGPGSPKDAGTNTSSCAPGGARGVCFVSPKDGDEVASPLHVVLASDDFPIEAANGNDSVRRGHFLIVIDEDCGGVARVVSDAHHLELSGGEHEAFFDLPSGTHRLCVQAVNGSHYTIDHLLQRIEILVR